MHAVAVLLALLPVIVVFLLLTVRHMAADRAGLIGWLTAILATWLWFGTPLKIALWISLAGVVASLPITLMVATSIFQITVMQETGAISRIVSLVKAIAPQSPVVQIMIINVGVGTLLAALGATPVSILPPIMLALGYSSLVSIALPALGYDALCTYALLGIPVVVFANFVGLPVNVVGGYFARYMPVISTCIAFGMLWIVGRWKMMVRGFVPTVLAGVTAGGVAIAMNAIGLVTLTGVAAGIGVVAVMMAYLKLTGKPLVDRARLAEREPDARPGMTLGAAISPWLILTAAAFLVNAPFLPLFDLLFKRLAMPLVIIPGAPEKIRLFWQAYFWILVATVLAFPFLRPSKAHLTATARRWLKRAPRPMLASAVFFAIAFLFNHSGKNADWLLLDPTRNMVQVVAGAAAAGLRGFYPLIAPFLGLLGGFISGSEASAMAMLTKLHLAISDRIGAVGIVVAAASGIGGGLASVISPAKLQNAAAAIDRIGEEARVIPTAFMISIVITLVCALMTFYWAF